MIINRNNFLVGTIPKMHPMSSMYREFWMTQKRRCIEGYWNSGYWMPGNLYFYVNFGTIKINKTASSKNKVAGKPFLRDLEWEFFYNWQEARGFSGFILDQNYTCSRKAQKKVYEALSDVEKNLVSIESPNAFKSDGTLKEYVPARQYLRKQHLMEYGRPVYENESLDFMMMGSRGFGKSYSVGVGIVLHEWLFDGETHYIAPLERDHGWTSPSASIMVGAGDAKYSADILDKCKFALKNLPGAVEISGVSYPSPFDKQYFGSWMPGKAVTAGYKKKSGGSWSVSGSESKINHRTFRDNPFAANGLRCSVMVFEEIGMFDNLMHARNASVECQMNGAYKYGSMMFLGTGGDMDGGTIDASSMFNDPDSYNLLAFEDLWESKGKIAYFVPAYLGLNQYKDSNGFSQTEAAREYLEKHRAKLRKGKSGSAALDDELQNRPLVPSEVFLTKKGNVFPIAELQERLNDVRDFLHVLEKPVTLFFDKEAPSGVNYKLDLKKDLLPLNQFPLSDQQKSNRNGCVVIYEFPVTDNQGLVPKDLYIIGHDPYATDDPDGGSLGSVFVLKTNTNRNHGHSEVVAEFTGRPYEGRKIINENIHKLSLMYGEAKVYFENVRGNVKEYFEKVRRLDLLALQPVTVLNNKKASWESRSSSQIYGYPMSNKKMKEEGIQYIRDWLLENRGADSNGKNIRNLDLLPSKGLLQELIKFNYDGNFDRVMAFMGCIIGLEETHNQYIESGNSKNEGLDLSFLRKNNNLFINNTVKK